MQPDYHQPHHKHNMLRNYFHVQKEMQQLKLQYSAVLNGTVNINLYYNFLSKTSLLKHWN